MLLVQILQLFSQYSKKFYYFAKGYLDSKEDAEGLVQEVFLKVWEKRRLILLQDGSFIKDKFIKNHTPGY